MKYRTDKKNLARYEIFLKKSRISETVDIFKQNTTAGNPIEQTLSVSDITVFLELEITPFHVVRMHAKTHYARCICVTWKLSPIRIDSIAAKTLSEISTCATALCRSRDRDTEGNFKEDTF